MLVKTFGNHICTKSLRNLLVSVTVRTCFGISNFNGYFTVINPILLKQWCLETSNIRKFEAQQANHAVNKIILRNKCSEVEKTCKKPPPSDEKVVARYQYHEEVEQAINKQILAEFNAAYSYLGLACYFGRTSVGLLGTQKFYLSMFDEENTHAMALIKYQEMRGGSVNIVSININQCEECTILKSLEISLCMEKEISNQLIEVYSVAKKHNDFRTQDLIVTEFIKEQIQSIRQLGTFIADAQRLGDSGLAEFFLDQKMSTVGGHSTA